MRYVASLWRTAFRASLCQAPMHCIVPCASVVSFSKGYRIYLRHQIPGHRGKASNAKRASGAPPRLGAVRMCEPYPNDYPSTNCVIMTRGHYSSRRGRGTCISSQRIHDEVIPSQTSRVNVIASYSENLLALSTKNTWT